MCGIFAYLTNTPDINKPIENIENDFKLFDKNEIEELTCYNFFKANCGVH